MSDIVTIAGSPSRSSKSSVILDYLRLRLEQQGLSTNTIDVRDLLPEDLFLARFDGPSILPAKALIEQAQTIIIATPVYKAAYSGILKAFLDLLPQNVLNGKIVLPIATGGSPAHLLAIDYSLKPVLSALGATHILAGIHIVDSNIKLTEDGQLNLTDEIEVRLDQALTELTNQLHNNSQAKPLSLLA
jgi:FMN reductase